MTQANLREDKKMRGRTFGVVLAVLVTAGTTPSAQEIFSDGFEWGSTCAWSNDLWYPDGDGDLFGDDLATGVPSGCPPPAGMVDNNRDCDDAHPECTTDCVTDVDDDLLPDCLDTCIDVDEDGYGQGIDCSGPDCDDGNYDVHPGATDPCDGLDNDCDPSTPDGSGESWYGDPCDGPDTDLCEEGVNDCVDGSLWCTDTSDDTEEICGNGLDEDCDGIADDGCCAHDVCESGVALDETMCEPCVGAVCAVDPWCCSAAWDEFCQEKVYACCNSTCDGPGSGCTMCGTCSGTDPLNPAAACGEDSHCKPQEGSGSPGLCIEGVGTSGHYGICTASIDCVADATCVDIGAANWSVCLQWCRMGSSDCTAGETCEGFNTAKYIGSQEWGACVGVPAAWICPDSYFGDMSCDCGCGVFDPDCVDSTVGSCDYCGFGCGTGTCPANIDPDENWNCLQKGSTSSPSPRRKGQGARR